MTQPKARDNELTAVNRRDLFELCPSDDERDKERWRKFRERYHAASRVEFLNTEFPPQLDFELSSTCQLKCSFCLHGQQRVEKRVLGRPLFEKAILEGERYGLCSIKMNYINEPLLLRDFASYVEFAKAHGVLNVYFATNGLLLTEGRARELIDAGVTKIMVSLDATTPETFQRVRQSDQLPTIVRNVEKLIDLRNALGASWPVVRVNFLRTKLNAHEADEFLAQWTDVADTVGFQVQVGLPGTDNNFLGDRAEELETFRCSFPFKMIVVDSGGDLLPCCTFSGRSMPLGNIRDMTIREAWTSPKMIELKRLHQNGDWRQNSTCAYCVNGCSS